MNHLYTCKTRQEKNFTIVNFATRSQSLTTPPTTSCMETATLCISFESGWVTVSTELPWKRKWANFKDPQLWWWQTSYRKSQKISTVSSMSPWQKKSNYVELLDPQLDDNVFGFLKLSSASNFGERNFCRKKFSRYTVVWLLCQDSYQTSCLSVVKWSRSC